MTARADPRGKSLKFAEFADRSNAAEVESSVAGELLDAGWKSSRQWLVIGGQFSAVSRGKTTTSSRKGYHFIRRIGLTCRWPSAADHSRVMNITASRHKGT